MTSSFRPEPRTPQGFVSNPLPRPAHPFRGRRAERAEGELAAPQEQRSDPEELLRDAYQRGREAGRAELPWREAEALQSARLALEKAVSALDDERRASLRAQRETVIELALAVAGRILEREVTIRLDALEPLLESSVSLLSHLGPVVLHLAPGDLETLRTGGAPELERLAGFASLRIESDPQLRPGDARLSAGSTGVDARVESILAQFRLELGELVCLGEEAE